jgi:hypothetical protein
MGQTLGVVNYDLLGDISSELPSSLSAALDDALFTAREASVWFLDTIEYPVDIDPTMTIKTTILGPRGIKYVLDAKRRYEKAIPPGRGYRWYAIAQAELNTLVHTFADMYVALKTIKAYNEHFLANGTTENDTMELMTYNTTAKKFTANEFFDALEARTVIYARVLQFMSLLTHIFDTWELFIDSVIAGAPSVRPDILVVHFLQRLDVGDLDPSVIFECEVRALNLINFYVRKWQELSMLDECVASLHAAMDPPFGLNASLDVLARRLVTFGQEALKQKTVISLTLHASLEEELKGDEAWYNKFCIDLLRQYHRDYTVEELSGRVGYKHNYPFILYITTHGSMSRPYLAPVPPNTSIVRFPVVPPGALSYFQLHAYGVMFESLKKNMFHYGGIRAPQVLQLLRFHWSKLVDVKWGTRQKLTIPMSHVTLMKPFAKRYMPPGFRGDENQESFGEMYPNKTYSITAEELASRPPGSVNYGITLLHGDINSAGEETVEQLDVLEAMGKPTGPVTMSEMVEFIQQRYNNPILPEIFVIDFSCAPFVQKRPPPRGAAQAVEGFLDYDSDPERIEKAKKSIAERFFGGGRRA